MLQQLKIKLIRLLVTFYIWRLSLIGLTRQLPVKKKSDYYDKLFGDI